MRVTEIAAPFDMSLPAVSKHLRRLERAGLIRREVRGRDHYLSINLGPLDDVRLWIDKVRDFWNERLDRLERLLREENARRPPAKEEKLMTTAVISFVRLRRMPIGSPL